MAMTICPHCGEESPEGFRFCGHCGSRLEEHVHRQTSRKTVTIVFSDLRGSTSLGEQLDGESMWEVLSVYFEAMKAVLERHGGKVEKYIGDAIMAVFGLPQAHEDDALRAVRAAAEMRSALTTVNERLMAGWGVTLHNRTGVHTGEVVAGDPTAGERLVTGDTVNVAARLEQAAGTDEVLIGPATHELVRDVVDADAVEPLDLKGKSEKVDAWRLIAVHGGEAIQRRIDTPMVGRQVELARLRESFQLAVEDPSCRVVTLIGHAGLGKSRLIAEFVSSVRAEATVLEGRCLSYGDGITFWPLAEIIRQAARVTAADSHDDVRRKLESMVGNEETELTDRFAALIGISDTAYEVDEIRWAARHLFENLGRREPLVVVFDDIHWAEPTLLELIEGIASSAREAPILILCAARHALYDHSPNWMEGRPQAVRVTLAELSAGEGAQVVRNLLGEGVLPVQLEERILETSAGNPLFVEQMIAMLVDDRVLVEEGDHSWNFHQDAGEVIVPASISALLTARLDRLEKTERSVIEAGSVMGQVFYPTAVEAIIPDSDPGLVASALEALERKRLVVATETDIVGEAAFRFSHILVQDHAYKGLLKRSRAQLHERFGVWLAKLAGTRTTEYEEILGYHFEQAFFYSSELGRIDDSARAVGQRACRHLRSAGERALGRADLPAATNLMGRAAALLDEGDPGKPRLLLEVGDALTEMGELERAANTLDDALWHAIRRSDHALQTSALLARVYLGYTTDPRGVEEHVVEEAERAISEFEPLGRHDVLVRAWRLLIRVRFAADMYGPAEEAVEQAIEHARADGDFLRARRVLGGRVMCALYGPRPVPEAIVRCEEVLAAAAHDRKTTAIAQGALAHLEAMRGDFARARMLYRLSRGTLEEFGWALLAATTSIDSGPIEMLAGDYEAAERELRGDYDTLRKMGEHSHIAMIAALLAGVVYELGRLDEADELARAGKELASPDDPATQALWRGVRAKLIAREGLSEDALSLARSAVQYAEKTDYLEAQGNALLDLADVCRLCGETEEQASALRQAAKRFETKGNLVGLARCRTGGSHADIPANSQAALS
jgi:class 3 adenylate cyclase/tetratricopeptide (TPR) repeat protein